MDTRKSELLTINTGSSSLKAALYRLGSSGERTLSAQASGIGTTSAKLAIVDAAGRSLEKRQVRLSDHQAALDQLFRWLDENDRLTSIAAVGHRIVHGGLRYQSPQRIDAELVSHLRELVPLAPDHLPQSIAAIEAAQHRLGAIPQVACFDTEFHRTLPPRARTLPVPRSLAEKHTIVRFGFHGLSYEYLVERLREIDPAHTGGRTVLAHLGNGASMAAVRDGQSRDTSMGFTPAGGLVMGTRTGDLDPGVLVYLLQTKNVAVDALNDFVNQQSGLVGIAGTSDMRELIAGRRHDPSAALSVELFCYQARKFLGAYAAALGGLDTIVFSGGIGENSAEIRAEICDELEFLGIRIDPAHNRDHGDVISASDSRVTVRVIRTDEDQMIARHTERLLAKET